MAVSLPSGDLARVKSTEADEGWPTLIEVVAYWGPGGRKGKRKSIQISGDQFFGRGHYGAPMGGDQLVAMVDRLRRGKV